MEDAGELIKSAVITLEKDGKKDRVILPGVDFKRWAIVRNELLARKKKAILLSATSMREHLPLNEFEDLRRAALQEVGRISSITVGDLQEMLTSEDGITLLVWVLAEQVRPGKYTEQDISDSMGALENPEIVSKQLEELLGIEGEEKEGDGEKKPKNEGGEEEGNSSP